MYKLVVVGGKLRGEEFTLAAGESIIGRDDGCSIKLAINGISKKHVSITVKDDSAYLQDLGSSNGTFVNGKMVKRAQLNSGDKIALPDAIIQVVYIREKKVIIKKNVGKLKDADDDGDVNLDGGSPPNNIIGKVIHLFKYRLMKPLYGINEEYEWKILIGIVLAVFVVVIISSAIGPVLLSSRDVLKYETAKRGAHYADEIARLNNRALESGNLDSVDTSFIEREDDVASYELMDLEGRIVRPMAKLNEYTQDAFAIQAKVWATKQNTTSKVYIKELDAGQIGIAQKIMVYNPKIGVEEAVGVIAIHFSPKSLAVAATNDMTVYMEALATAGIAAVVFFGIFYFLTTRSFEELRVQIEEATRGKRKTVEGRYLMFELDSIKNTINTMLTRLRELQSDGTEKFQEVEDDAPYVTQLIEFLNGCHGSAMVLDSQKNLQKLNTSAEDVTSIREAAAKGASLLDSAREQGFAATVIELCDNSANNHGTSQKGEYELAGIPHKIFVSGLIGKDGLAKAFYVTLVPEK